MALRKRTLTRQSYLYETKFYVFTLPRIPELFPALLPGNSLISPPIPTLFCFVLFLVYLFSFCSHLGLCSSVHPQVYRSTVCPKTALTCKSVPSVSETQRMKRQRMDVKGEHGWGRGRQSGSNSRECASPVQPGPLEGF